jgi:hypothetical protein
LVYRLKPQTYGDNKEFSRLKLVKQETIYTPFHSALDTITKANPGDMNQFIKLLQEKLDEQMESSPVNQTLDSPFE